MEISSPLEIAKDLKHIGVLSMESYNAFEYNFIHIFTIAGARYPLANFLLDELVDPITFDNFKDFLRINLPMSYEVLSSMGEY